MTVQRLRTLEGAALKREVSASIANILESREDVSAIDVARALHVDITSEVLRDVQDRLFELSDSGLLRDRFIHAADQTRGWVFRLRKADEIAPAVNFVEGNGQVLAYVNGHPVASLTERETDWIADYIDGETAISGKGATRLSALAHLLGAQLPLDARNLWDSLGDVPVDNEDRLELQWLMFSKDTHREDVWTWFEQALGVAVHDLMYPGSA